MQLPPTLTMREARAASVALAAALTAAGREPRLAVDASTLRDLDTAALAVLLQARRDAQARGMTLLVDGAPPKLCQLAALYGVDGLLGLDATQPGSGR